MIEAAHVGLLQDLAVVMIVAGAVTLLFHRLRQPVVLGYILAGVIIGPYTLPFPLVQDQESIKTLAELGVVFLMFSLGLHFSLRQLRQVGATAMLAATLEILLMLWVGYEVGLWFGWSKLDSIFLGAILSISSTTIIVKALTDLGKIETSFARIVFGILIVEDVLAIAMIALLSSLGQTGELQAGTMLVTFGRVAGFLGLVLVAGLLTVPALLRYVARTRSDEMLLVTALALCFGVSLLAVQMGYSVALGAFLIGTVIGETRQAGPIQRLTAPVRDTFSAVFFVAIGMLIEPQLLRQYAWPIAVITVAVVVGKVLTCGFGTFVAGHDTRTSLRVGMSLAQIGEFSFIIAALGLSLQVTSDFLYPIAVTVSAITTLLTPYLIRGSDPLVSWFDRTAPDWLVGAMNLYSRRLEQWRESRRHNAEQRLIWKWVGQMALNLGLASGALLTAEALGDRVVRWWPNAPVWLGGARGVVGLVACVVGLPMLVATVRKLEALALLVGEMAIPRQGETPPAGRTVVARTVFVGGAVVIGLWVLLLSAMLLPPGPELIVLAAIVLALVAVFWRFLIQIHARAQVALRDTLAGANSNEAQANEVLPLLSEVGTEVVILSESSPAGGQLIRELHLRRNTGAVIVLIERGQQRVVNPGPDEELRPGDRLLLLGSATQLAAARAVFGTKPGAV